MTASSRPLGSSGLLVSPLGLGTVTFGREVLAADAARLVHLFLDRGFNLLDTADSYADGAAEEVLGAALRGRRDDVVLTTKAGLPLHPGPDRSRSSRRHLMRSLEGSLRRLRTDHVDVFYLHRWDDQAPIEESLSTLDAMITSGKIRYAAVSNFTGWQLAWTNTLSLRHGWERVIAVQARYSLAARHAEREILPYCRWSGLGFVAYAPLGGGLLTGKYIDGRQFPPGSRAESASFGASLRRRLTPAAYSMALRVQKLAAAAGITAGQLSLAWLLSRRGMSSAVVGATSEGQLAENLTAASLDVDQSVLDELEAATALPLGYPYDLLQQLGSAGDEMRS